MIAYDLDGMYARMRSCDGDNLVGKPYSGTTVQKMHTFLKMLFNKAIDYDYIEKNIEKNPCSGTSAPKRDTKEKVALTADQAKALVSAIESEPIAAKQMAC